MQKESIIETFNKLRWNGWNRKFGLIFLAENTQSRQKAINKQNVFTILSYDSETLWRYHSDIISCTDEKKRVFIVNFPEGYETIPNEKWKVQILNYNSNKKQKPQKVVLMPFQNLLKVQNS